MCTTLENEFSSEIFLNYAREMYVLYGTREVYYHLKYEQREIYYLTHSTMR